MGVTWAGAALMAAIAALGTTVPQDSSAAPTAPDAQYLVEVAELGKEHADEHLRERADVAVPARRIAKRSATRDPAIDGSWSSPVWPDTDTVAVSAVMLRTGKVLMFGNRHADGAVTAEGSAWLLDPTTGIGREVDPPNNTFCSGHTLLADGRVLVVGGRAPGPGRTHPAPGIVNTVLFDPVTETWTRGPDTAEGRWYPTVTELADGSALIVGGHTVTGQPSEIVERFFPGTPSTPAHIETVADEHYGLYYPKQWVVGPDTILEVDKRTAYFGDVSDPSRVAYRSAGRLSQSHESGPDGVLLAAGPGEAPHRALILGGSTVHLGQASNVVEMLDVKDRHPRWLKVAPMPEARMHMNAVLAPDGTVIGIGGNASGVFVGPTTAVLRYHPDANAWDTLAAQVERRAYHSTALLLPDGRILSAGDTGRGGGRESYEIYSPPYLFHGARPAISSAPSQFDWGSRERLAITGPVDRLVLIAPGSVTHATDMNQRIVVLATDGDQSQPTVTVPGSAVLPPGWYMLFAVTAAGVPSIARWVHVGTR